MNAKVLTSASERNREYLFLLLFLQAISYINIGLHSEEKLRRIVLCFVEEVLLLDGAISQVSAEHFGSQPMLFSDSVLKLQEQLDLANKVLEYFNLIAQKLNFKELIAGTEDRRMTSPSATPTTYPFQNEPIWSRSEKNIARRAFDPALGRELHEVIQEAQKMASQIRQSTDLWDLEHYLTRRRKEIDRKYDYRYSQLAHVFGRLLFEGRLTEEELRGLHDDKLTPIRSFARFLAEDAA